MLDLLAPLHLKPQTVESIQNIHAYIHLYYQQRNAHLSYDPYMTILLIAALTLTM